jgi:uncharacterized membrane protein
MTAVSKSRAAPPRVARSKWTLEKVLPWLLLIGGVVALVASVGLSIEVFNRLKNPHYVPICNLNPILSCTSVADSHQAEAFGFPNYFIGIAGYAAVATIGAVLLAGARLAKWFWRLLGLGIIFAVAFVTWLQFETLYRIGALCIFCMIVWGCTIPIFWYTALYSFQKGYIGTPRWFRRPLAFLRRHHADVMVVWFLIIIALILKRFWYYWHTVI